MHSFKREHYCDVLLCCHCLKNKKQNTKKTNNNNNSACLISSVLAEYSMFQYLRGFSRQSDLGILSPKTASYYFWVTVTLHPVSTLKTASIALTGKLAFAFCAHPRWAIKITESGQEWSEQGLKGAIKGCFTTALFGLFKSNVDRLQSDWQHAWCLNWWIQVLVAHDDQRSTKMQPWRGDKNVDIMGRLVYLNCTLNNSSHIQSNYKWNSWAKTS